MTPQTLAIHVTFESDWGVGTGAGRHGSLDRVVVTDDFGLPMIPAKTITGILRDAAEQAAYGLDDAQVSGRWAAWVDWLFGSSPSQGPATRQRPVPAVLAIRPGYLIGLREAVRAAPKHDPNPDAPFDAGHQTSSGRQEPEAAHAGAGVSTARPQGIIPVRAQLTRSELAAAAVIVRPGVEVDRTSGVAADDTLRMEQWARAGQTVHAEATATVDLPDEAQLLLRLAANLATSLGGKRRRGLGACRITVDGLTEPGRDRAESLAKDPETPPPNDAFGDAPAAVAIGGADGPSPADTAPDPDAAATRGGMRRLGTIDVTCLTPLAVSSATVSNTVLSLDFIPGGNLLPIVARALGGHVATERIRDGRIVVTDALVVRAGQRALPMPRALQAPKRAPATDDLYNALDPCDVRVLAVPGYLTGGTEPGDPATVHRLDLVEAAHAVIDDASQRPTHETGGLFIQQAIPSGTLLRAELWADTDVVVDLPARAAVGRSKKDDYGWVELLFTPEPRAPGGSAVAGSTGGGGPWTPSHGCRADGRLRVWLTADALLSTAGHPDPSPPALARAVGQAIGRDLSVHNAAFVTWRRHETWSARWALPRPSLIGLAAGSVVELEGATCDEEGCPWPALQALAASGVGARRPEGFGRLVFNPATLERARVPRREPTDTDLASAATPGEGAIQAPPVPATDTIVTAQAWRDLIDARAMEFALRHDLRARVIPKTVTKAQLGALRGAVTALAADSAPGSGPGWDLAVAWLEPLTSTDPAKRNDKRAAKWQLTEPHISQHGNPDVRQIGIADWLGVGLGRAGRKRWPGRIADALGIDVDALRGANLLGYARTALLLHCVTQASRALQTPPHPERTGLERGGPPIETEAVG